MDVGADVAAAIGGGTVDVAAAIGGGTVIVGVGACVDGRSVAGAAVHSLVATAGGKATRHPPVPPR